MFVSILDHVDVFHTVEDRRLHRIFRGLRLLLIAALIVLQIILMVNIFLHFREAIPQLAALEGLFTLAMFFYLYNCGMDASAKLTWMIVITLFPLPGAIFLAYTRTNLGHRLVKARTAELIEQTRNAIPQNEAVMFTS